MSSGVAPATTVGAEASVGSAVEIDVDGRWDALALSELHPLPLVPRSAHGPALGRARPSSGSHGEPLADALRAIEEWQAERRLDGSVRVAGRPVG